ncbi:methylmalonyl-CoA mutase metallochaperone MeaB [Arboricoccus pini]|uniref:Methylmalonyl-CoA mutase metallochaperone MeaB n=1 Tax=Arboricoccus pini TaxID=1963835 RepID=A0A212RE12_9PROT|nr:methylmalonyl Co-A mutase-associated GTPase MeaB [Arboricoccus pini]SNB70540.1 methylmalonyl-CoA mutase metallochaperone MeaB [Arboricoccus pini]
MAETAAELAKGVAAGERAALARAITALESQRPDRAALGQAVLAASMARTGGAFRIGVTGVPGVGKSSLIEALGMMLVERGLKVAVLALDPTSERTGGSILGDKTRMTRLSGASGAFVRPSPTSGTLGGVGRMTREALLLCEAAGHDVVMVETVGVGQSETIVARMVDLFLFLVLPGAGDALQGIKKGIVELADVIAVTKADGEARLKAAQAARHYEDALAILAPRVASWRPPVMEVSALEGAGLAALWAMLERHRQVMQETGAFADRRRVQNRLWFETLLDQRLRDLVLGLPGMAARIAETGDAVAAGQIEPGMAVLSVLERLNAWFGA